MAANHDPKCEAAEQARVKEAREKYGLSSGSLGVTEIANDSTLVIIGFFTSLVSTRMNLFVPEHRKIHVALIAISLTFLLFAIIGVLVDALSLLLWRLSSDYATTIFRFLKFICSIALVMTSHFLSDLLLAELSGNLSWVEAFCTVFEGILGVYVLLQLFHISSTG
jgi:hypothetical protein